MRTRAILPLALLTLLATACGGDDSDSGSGTTAATGGSSGSGGSGGSSAAGSGGSGAEGSSMGGSGGSTASGGSGGTGGSGGDTTSTGGTGGSETSGAGGAGGAGMTRFRVSIENLEPDLPIRQSGAFTTPDGAPSPAPLAPGESYQLTFAAAPGDRLSFATMFVQSNDLFLAPAGEGIELFDGDDAPISGDVSNQVIVWDAGTEEDEPLGEGDDQAPRQSGPDTGAADDDSSVRMVDSGDFANLPDVADMFSAMLTADVDGIHFTLTITNESMAGDLTTSGAPVDILFSPGVFAVHNADDILFTEGEAASMGLERIAEDGDPSVMLEMGLAPRTGITTPLAPGIWAVHGEGGLFEAGAPDLGLGMEALAEDGDPSGLLESIADLDVIVSSGVFNTPDGADEPGPALPGSAYSFEFEANEGDRLSFATMFVQSNDLFFATAEDGIELFDLEGMPLEGDITSMVMLWDAGTEVNEAPGLGPNQAPRQNGPDTGDDEAGNVGLVDDGYSYARPETLLGITIEVR